MTQKNKLAVFIDLNMERLNSFIDYNLEKWGAKRKQFSLKTYRDLGLTYWTVRVAIRGKYKKKLFVQTVQVSQDPTNDEMILFEVLKVIFESLERSIIKNFFTGK